MKLVLDTNIYSDFAEGIPETVEFLASHGEFLYLPAGRESCSILLSRQKPKAELRAG